MPAKKTISDVSKPGKTPADPTARPIITGHAIMKDPMVNEDKSQVAEAETTLEPTVKEAVAPSAAHKVIQPLESDDKPAAAKETEEKKPEEPAEETAVSDEAVVDAVVDQVGDKKKETKESEEDRKRQEAVDRLVAEKKYFVPVAGKHSKRNNKLALIIIAAMLPVIIGLGLAADAGVVDLGFKVPFDFIKDKPAQSAQTPSTTQPVIEQPTTQKITGKLFNFSIEIHSSWAAGDHSDTKIGVLNATFNDSKSDNAIIYKLHAPVGNFGRCTPAKVDTPHAAKNLCPTYEETELTETQYGYILTTKYTVLGKTTNNLCFRPKTTPTGETVVMTQANLNKPVMGPYLECRDNDISITAGNTKAEVLDVFKQASYKQLQEALKTITFTYPKPQ